MTASVPGPRAAPTLPAELRASTAFLLARVGFAMKLAAVDEFEQAGISLYQYSVLAVLAEGAKETQAEIADALTLDRSQLVGVLDTLEEEGLVERRRDQSDRRRHTVSLTPAGESRLATMRTIARRLEDSFLAPLDDEARAVLHDALLRIAAHRDDRFSVL
jgi:DNA-binding MarR family transcriptional regulator